MAYIKDHAIVLRRLDYSETSLVLAIFTREHGQQRVIAKGVKRATKTRPSIGIDLLEHGAVVFSQRAGKESNLSTMTEWRQSDTFPHLRTDLSSWYAAQYAAEITSQLTEVGDPHPLLYDGMLQLLKDLETQMPLEALLRYLWIALTEIGLRPEMQRCVGCQRPVGENETLYFSNRAGGAICRDCEPSTIEKRRMTSGAAAILRRLAETGESQVPGATTGAAQPGAAFDVIDYHITQIMARPPRLSEMLKRTLRQ